MGRDQTDDEELRIRGLFEQFLAARDEDATARMEDFAAQYPDDRDMLLGMWAALERFKRMSRQVEPDPDRMPNRDA